MKRFLSVLLAVVLFLTPVFALAAGSAKTLVIPKDTTVIGKRAYANTTKVEDVILPEGILEIRDGAFSGSSVRNIYLPASLTFIADDAFENCENVHITAAPDSYAYQWVKENGYLVPAGYPTPLDGVDLHGKEVLILNYWGGSDWHGADVDSMTEHERATYEYRTWIEEVYNCRVREAVAGNWGTIMDEVIGTAIHADPIRSDAYCLYVVPPDHLSKAFMADALAAWTGDLSDSHWNKATTDFMRKGGKVYGTSALVAEPRQCVFFNKRILAECGIDWESIYDMQKNGTWTWSAFESLVRATNAMDGVSGLSGSSSDLFMISVFSNGGSFFSWGSDGKLKISSDSSESLAALNWSKKLWNNYARKQGENDSWDYYKTAWYNGEVAFYIYQAYGGFNSNSEMSGMADEWGCVAFPIGPSGNTYKTIVSSNVTVIPNNCYTSDEIRGMIAVYDLWTRDTPGYNESGSWVGGKLNYTDRRAVYETYGMLRKSEHQVTNLCMLLGSVNDVLGIHLLWYIENDDPASLIEAARPSWQSMLDVFN